MSENSLAPGVNDDIPQQETPTLYRAKIIHSSATEICAAGQNMAVAKGDLVIIPTRYGKELAVIQGIIGDEEREKGDIQEIDRKASEQDLEQFKANQVKEEKAFNICQQKIEEHELEMKLVSGHYLMDEPKILFYFTAEERVDFRELVRDLVSIFKTRIELRQIGVRDEARVLGGAGVCGRVFCCHSLTDKLKPVSIKMAKEQNLTLNSMKISGPCGRLLCCLSYEYDCYWQTKQNLPAEGVRLAYQGESFKVVEVSIFHQRVRLQGEKGGYLDLDFDRFNRDRESGKWQVLED
jgi:cell fate regulator YaaT (PSP1 superfamily)